MTRPLLALAALVAALAVAPAPASAVPPGGAVQLPRGAAVTLDAATVAPDAAVGFRGTGFLPGESVSVKLDDGAILAQGDGSVFLVVVADGAGTIVGALPLAQVRADQRAQVVAGEHSLRFLSSAGGSPRSFSVPFAVDPAAATAGTPAPSPAAAPAPSAAPAPAPSPSATPAPSAAPPADAPAAVASTRLRATGTATALRLRGGSAAQRVAISVRTRRKVSTRSGRRVVAVTRAVRATLAAGAERAVRLRLTRAGRAALRRTGRLAVVVRVAPTDGGPARVARLTLRG